MKLEEVSPHRVTPMLRQYLQAKAECGDSLLFFRMGDFYELFFEDAIEAAELLGLTLTSRDDAGKDRRVPMAGVPFRAVDGYVARVLKAGRTVTLCDQIEDPKEAKGIVKRAVVRTITPGTVMAPELLDETANNYLCALALHSDKAGLAFVDISTGEFLVAQIEDDLQRALHDEFTRMNPAEVLVARDADEAALKRLRDRFRATTFTPRPEIEFDPQAARDLLLDFFGVSTLKGFGIADAPEAVAGAGAAVAYVKQTQRDMAPHLQFPRRYSPAGYVVLDGNTQRNLELIESLADKRKHGTLLGVLDRTLTPMGGRMLRQWILHPLVDVQAIRARLDAVEALHEDTELRLGVRELLRGVADLERLLGRISSKSGNARDLKALGASLTRAPALRQAIAAAQAPLVRELHDDMDELADVSGWIESAIVDAPPLAMNEGKMFQDGYNADLDHLRGLVRGGKDWIAALKKEETERTGIQNLKVGYNKVFGYYIEVSRANAHLVPPDYERKQTLVNAERYVTPTLKAREEEIVTAEERMCKLEYDLFVALRGRVAAEARRIRRTANAIAALDVVAGLAEVAAHKGYCKPTVDGGDVIHIRDGRHPVVEDLMARGDFVPNDTLLEPARACLQIVTGPNMAGKSTYLRQVALIVLMAQIGGFVPATEARIGVVDRVFTRVGASDNLVRGESTFMVEMIESANILNAATARSLIVLDEIGRGTSTFDGISIAWSVAEHIHDHVHAKTLFATHYHELTELGEKLERAKNLNVAVREWGDKVVFLYRIVDGGADHSYGIQVAKLAGLPPAVIRRARDILESLEAGNPVAAGLPQQMYLFGPQTPPEPNPVERELELVDPDALSPKEAHEFLYHLKHMLRTPRHEKSGK
ncbi:MAG TPA: DNA mismatch repair protein MutS [Candidatus Hydrogenedentes bacterium]|nr:DNA mismatch repair protein MutS [Candidatus Hydrogenedentota bacterium]